MNVSALFSPDESAASPGTTAAFKLQLQNTSDTEQVVSVTPSGDLAEHTVVPTQRVHLDPHELFELPIVFDPGPHLLAGPHECRVDVSVDDTSVSATARVDVSEYSAHTTRLDPPTSRSSKAGRHSLVVTNAGNTAVLVDLALRADADLEAELAAPSVAVEPGKTAKVELRLRPHDRFWNGEPVTHEFGVDVLATGEEPQTMEGEYVQTARMPAWFVPALAGMLGALIIWLLLWWLFFRPAVEDIARDEASELDAIQQAELDQRVEAIEQAAAEAAELPLGQPTDLRLSVSAGPGTEATEAFDFDRSGTGRTLSISDIIFQNPTGAVGIVEFLRNDEVLLAQEMANFRDLDFHLVAPFRVDSGSSIALRVVCSTPGPTAGDCEVSATIAGFVDGP